jgi:hypothetical protein
MNQRVSTRTSRSACSIVSIWRRSTAAIPRKGLDGCYPIAKFWANLTGKSASGRAGSLEKLYFTGVSDRDRDGSIVTFGPIIHVDNFCNDIARGGQVRTNQFVNATSMASTSGRCASSS